jgi:hypothetical protein
MLLGGLILGGLILGGLILREAVICDIQYYFNNVILCVRRLRHFQGDYGRLV